MADGLKIVRIHARHVPVTDTSAIDADASLISEKRQCRVLDETKKIVSGQPADVWQWPLTVCLLHFDTNLSNLIVKKIQC